MSPIQKSSWCMLLISKHWYRTKTPAFYNHFHVNSKAALIFFPFPLGQLIYLIEINKNWPDASALLFGTTQSIKIFGTSAQFKHSAISPNITNGQIAAGQYSTITATMKTRGPAAISPYAATSGSAFDLLLRYILAANAPKATPITPHAHVTAPKPNDMTVLLGFWPRKKVHVDWK